MEARAQKTSDSNSSLARTESDSRWIRMSFGGLAKFNAVARSYIIVESMRWRAATHEEKNIILSYRGSSGVGALGFRADSATSGTSARGGPRRRPAAHAPGPESEFAIPSGSRLDAAGRRPEGRNPRAVHASQHCLSRDAAHLLGVRAGAVRSHGAGEPDGLPGRAGVQGREWRSADTECDGQSDLPARDSGDDRRVHQSGPPPGSSRTQPADRLGRWDH